MHLLFTPFLASAIWIGGGKINHASLIHTVSCQCHLDWRRLGRPPACHHHCGSIAPLTVEPFRRRLHQTARLSTQCHYENLVHSGSDFQGRTFGLTAKSAPPDAGTLLPSC